MYPCRRPLGPCLCVWQLTFQWGCGNYSGFGDGGAYDADGIGDNIPGDNLIMDPMLTGEEEPVAVRHIYEANGQRSGLAAVFH